MRKFLTHMGLITKKQLGRSAVGKEITEFHCTMEYCDANNFNHTKPEAFLKVRPDRVAFNEKARVCTFLELTRLMDDGASEQLNW